jgi:hypothetical protein
MKKCNLALFIAAVLPLVVSTPVMGTIISGTVTGGTALNAGGTFVKLTPPLANPFGPPDSVGNDNFQSPDLFGFDEDQNIMIGAPLDVNVGMAPATGTVVASHYIFFDPGPSEHLIGTVNFDSDVIAIITSTGTLAASDFLANTGVNYLNPGNRGLEAGDSVTISGAQQILFDTTASSPGDYVRVLTEFSPAAAAVPEPNTAPILGAGIAGIAICIYWRRRAPRRSGV